MVITAARAGQKAPPVVLMRGMLDKDSAGLLLDSSLNYVDWLQAREPSIPLPRRTAIFGNEAYTYAESSGAISITAEECPDWLWFLCEQLEDLTGYSYQLCVGNRYDDASQSIDWHDEARPEMGREPAVSFVSLGATQNFQVRRKPAFEGEETEIQNFELHHGDLLLMPPGFQEGWLHRLPKSNKPCDVRVNWTFSPWTPAA